MIKLRKNFISLKDSIFSFGSKSYEFYDVSESRIIRELKYDEDNLFEFKFELDQNQIVHSRDVYTILNLFKEAGGILIALKFIPGLILLPISHHKLIIAASKELFLLNKKCASLLVNRINTKKHQYGENHYGVSYSMLTSL